MTSTQAEIERLIRQAQARGWTAVEIKDGTVRSASSEVVKRRHGHVKR
jgi:deoxyribose-phosphate aldolase